MSSAMTTPDIQAVCEELERLLKKATPQNIDTAECVAPGIYECPLCDGSGDVEGVTYTNYDGVANGVQFFGVGPEHADAEALFRATIKALPSLLSYARRAGAMEEATIERCARVADGFVERGHRYPHASTIAKAIRALSPPTTERDGDKS